MANIKPLSTVDAAWLRMEDPTNLMMVSGILTFKEPVDFASLRAVIKKRLLQFDRFRMRVIEPKVPFAPAFWEYDPKFDLDAHVHHIALPEPGGKKELQALAGDLMSTPLDFSKPLWMVHIIDNFEGGTAVFVRLHHCIADGIALVFVLLSLTDFSPDGAPEPDDSKIRQPKSRRGLFGGAFTSMLLRSSNVMEFSRGITERALKHTQLILKNPAHAFTVAQWGGESAFATGRLLLRSNDPDSLFKGKLGTQKRAAWSRPLPLKDVKAIKNVTQTTVNDVLVSALTGSLRRYLVERGQDVRGLNFRAGVPVNLRQPDEMGTLGNKFGLFFLDMPVGLADPLDRLNEVHIRMQGLKSSQEGPAGLAILSTMGVTPKELHGSLVEMFGKKLTAVLTNVPGPPMPLYMAGKRLDGIMFWVPQSGRVGLGISIISYANKVFLGVATDAGLVPDPDEIIAGFYGEFEELLSLAKDAEIIAKEEAAQAKPAANDQGNLQEINGIGPTYARRLAQAGIHSVNELTGTPPEKLAEILGISVTRVENILAEAAQNGHPS